MACGIADGVIHCVCRSVLAQLGVSDRLTEATKQSGRTMFREADELMRESASGGAFRGQPPAFVAAILEALADVALGFVAREPGQAEQVRRAGFEAFWRAIATRWRFFCRMNA